MYIYIYILYIISYHCIVKAIEQAEEIIKRVMIEINDPSFAGLTCTPGIYKQTYI